VTTFGHLAELGSSSQLRIEELGTKEDQFNLFRKLYEAYKNVFILESLVGPKELSEMSVIGFDPELTVICDSKTFQVRKGARTIHQTRVKDPLLQLRSLLPKIHDERFRYIGGAVGYISYDAVRFWENLPPGQRRGLGFPLLEFGIYLDGILYNHKEDRAYYFYLGKSRLQELRQALDRILGYKAQFSYSRPKRNMPKSRYKSMVRKAKRYVYDGDVFQVVLAKSMGFSVQGSLIRLYEALREVNPSPYMYLLKMAHRCIIGSSPEMLIRVTNDFVETFPIAGTRPVVTDPTENDKLKQDLLKDEKELAEHTMLVDLARNDIGRVCRFGTVKVDELMTVKKFSHVQHIVSHVTGKLQNAYDSFDALRAVFPAGTVSGAPKVRAMEVIDELEPTMRGPYAGALGYFSFNGSCDFAITIRSLFVNKHRGYIASGAGIVMDSDPANEWAETEHKANAMLLALRKASSN
jgi:anthranilate synthase component 1